MQDKAMRQKQEAKKQQQPPINNGDTATSSAAAEAQLHAPSSHAFFIRQLCCANKCHKAQDCPAFAYAVNFIGQYVYPFDTN